MKLLIYSPVFHPSIGGLENVVAMLAEEISRRGHQVLVVCQLDNPEPDDYPFRVLRRPGRRQLLSAVAWCDLFFQANVSLRGLWPLALVRRPWVAAHHSWYCRPDGRIAWQDRVKRFLLRFAAASISVSRAMADDLETPSTVILNPYREDLFRRLPDRRRDGELIFVGRLVSDKGVDLLVEALARLAAAGRHPALTVVGDGPERPRLEAQAASLGVAEQIDFLGSRTGEELVELLNRHRILVTPSRLREPFGVVALEGIACGCAVVGSDRGGLPEAIGPCGRTFPNGDVAALARVLEELLADAEAVETLGRRAAEHLATHRRQQVGDAYLEVLEAVLARRRPALAAGAAGGGEP